MFAKCCQRGQSDLSKLSNLSSILQPYGQMLAKSAMFAVDFLDEFLNLSNILFDKKLFFVYLFWDRQIRLYRRWTLNSASFFASSFLNSLRHRFSISICRAPAARALSLSLSHTLRCAGPTLSPLPSQKEEKLHAVKTDAFLTNFLLTIILCRERSRWYTQDMSS